MLGAEERNAVGPLWRRALYSFIMNSGSASEDLDEDSQCPDEMKGHYLL